MTRKRIRPVVGLTLGGGGARGLAHIGVLKVLEEASIPVDLLSGASMGGLIGALYASGRSAADLECEALRMARTSQMLRLLDFSPPRRGLLKGDRLRSYLNVLLGEGCRFADLRLPLALTAVDLIHRCEVTLDAGSLVDAVLATIAVPGLFAPVFHGGQKLVDGGILNNVPADTARSMGAEVVIAVDVVYEEPESSGLWEVHGPRPFLTGLLPEFAGDFYRAEMIMTEAITRARLRTANPEILLHPPIPAGVTIFFGFHRAEEIIAAGEQAARAALPQIRALVDPKSE